MIPYVVTEPNPGHGRSANMHTSYGVCEDYTLTAHLTSAIAEIMYEFCSKEYGHGLQINSFQDFCTQWWEKQDYVMPNTPFYAVHFFWRGEWQEWKTDEYELELYHAYLAKVKEKQ